MVCVSVAQVEELFDHRQDLWVQGQDDTPVAHLSKLGTLHTEPSAGTEASWYMPIPSVPSPVNVSEKVAKGSLIPERPTP